MSDDKRTIFRPKSLERLSSPERLDQLLRVVDRKSWIPLATLALLVGAIIAWSFFGEVPVNVHGRGILVHPRQFVEIHAPGAGYIVELDVKVGDVVESGQEVAVIGRPDLVKRLELQRAKKDELETNSLRILGQQLERIGSDFSEIDGDDIEGAMALARELAGRLRHEEVERLDREEQRLQKQWSLVEKLPESLEERWAKQQVAFDEGVISEEELVRARSSYMGSLADVAAIESDLNELRSHRLQVEDDYAGRLQNIGDREQQLADVRREIDQIESDLERETRVIIEHGGRIVEIGALPGQYVNPGARLGAMAVSGVAEEMRSVIYFTVKDGKRLEAGGPIQVAPDTVERQRHGSIEATIEAVSSGPVSIEEAANVIGNRGLAEMLIAEGHRIQVIARLERDETTFSGFAWTSGEGPELVISVGTTTTSRAAVDKRHPISFVLPFFRSATGVD